MSERIERYGGCVPSAAESVGASAASTVTRARQMMGRRPNQQQVSSGMVRLVAISVSMLVSLGVAVAVWYGLNGVHKSGCTFFRVKHLYGACRSRLYFRLRHLCADDPQN